MTYELIIVGAGPAGLTAGIYAARSGLKTAVVSRTLGGTANLISSLENWPGFSGKGIDLMKKFYDQLNQYKVEVILEDVQSIEKKGKVFAVKISGGELETKAIILATGIKREDLKIPGEDRLKGKGISYCVTCDAFFFKDKIVGIIGKEDCSSKEILALAGMAGKVYVLVEGKRLNCERDLKKLIKEGKIEVIYRVVPEEILGEKKVEGIRIKDAKSVRELKLDGIFIEVGSVALTEFAKKLKLKLDKNNNIIVDEDMNTSVGGIFAAGDVTNSKLKQVLTGSSQGAIAAKSVGEYLKGTPQ